MAPIRCGECKLEVASKAALTAHWKQKRELGQRHFHCARCMRLFHSEETETRHRHEVCLLSPSPTQPLSPPLTLVLCQFHAAKQDLACPGCGDRFVSAAGLIEHIEKNRCNRIKNDDLAAHREQRLAFARELQRRHLGDDPGHLDNDSDNASTSAMSTTATSGGHDRTYNFTQFLSTTRDAPAATNPSLSALRPKADSTVRPNPVTFTMKKAEFPKLDVKQPDASTHNPPANAWAQKKNLFPDAPTAVRPPPETLQAVEAPSREPTLEWPPHDPRNRDWDPKKYFVSYINKYKCPHDRCP